MHFVLRSELWAARSGRTAGSGIQASELHSRRAKTFGRVVSWLQGTTWKPLTSEAVPAPDSARRLPWGAGGVLTVPGGCPVRSEVIRPTCLSSYHRALPTCPLAHLPALPRTCPDPCPV